MKRVHFKPSFCEQQTGTRNLITHASAFSPAIAQQTKLQQDVKKKKEKTGTLTQIWLEVSAFPRRVHLRPIDAGPSSARAVSWRPAGFAPASAACPKTINRRPGNKARASPGRQAARPRQYGGGGGCGFGSTHRNVHLRPIKST